MNFIPQPENLSLEKSIYDSYINRQPCELESSTSLVVNDWTSVGPYNTSGSTATVDAQLAARVWDHARRRAEDGCVILASMTESSPSLLGPFSTEIPFLYRLAEFPSFQKGIELIQAFTNCVTPENPSRPRYSSLAIEFNIRPNGALVSLQLKLPDDGLDLENGLLNIPSASGHRAFNVFYYLDDPKASSAEREALSLRPLNSYKLLNRSDTLSLPHYLNQTEDDHIARFRHNYRHFKLSAHILGLLSGLLLLGNALGENNPRAAQEICQGAAPLLDIDDSVLISLYHDNQLNAFIAAVYSKIVAYTFRKVTDTINNEIFKNGGGHVSNQDGIDDIPITVIDLASPFLGQATSSSVVFDDNVGLNKEMLADGITLPPTSTLIHSRLRELRNLLAFDLATDSDAAAAADPARDMALSQRHKLLDDIKTQHPHAFWDTILNCSTIEAYRLTPIVDTARVWFHLSLSPTDSPQNTVWNDDLVADISREWFLSEWIQRRFRNLDFTADYEWEDLPTTFGPLGCPGKGLGPEAYQNWVLNAGWDPAGLVIGLQRLWVREFVYRQMADALDQSASGQYGLYPPMGSSGPYDTTPFGDERGSYNQSADDLIVPSFEGSRSNIVPLPSQGGNYGLGHKGDNYRRDPYASGDGPHGGLKEVPTSRSRRVWVAITWALTFWIPSPLLSLFGRMKRSDVRMAWREKLALVMLILLINGIVVFYIIGFGRLLCPNFDKAWSRTEVATHQGRDDFWVSHSGHVYDLSKFWRLQHSDTAIATTTSNMEPFAGADMDSYIRPPLTLACSGLLKDDTLRLIPNNTNMYPSAEHVSGSFYQPDRNTALHSDTWYTDKFLPRMREYYKGDLVWTRKQIAEDGDAFNRPWVVIDRSVYDLTDYFHTLDTFNNQDDRYDFLDSQVTNMVKNNPGTDISQLWHKDLNSTIKDSHMRCLNNYFYVGKVDFRKEAQCVVNNYLLLVFTIILCSVIAIKFLAALQLGSKRRPTRQDKFVICQVPAYTEGEDQLRQGLNSLTALSYDNKRKLILVICDGVIIGAGNDRTTPEIVLDILGVDPKEDPPALPFYSIGTGSEKLNYGKVYSGLYEYEGNVVPYLVVVKVGKQSEQAKPKPGNRGKRDSQVLLMRFLNRVHHGAAMNPLELEMFRQLNHVIGVDPELYEYVLMVDADTMVKEDSLNRLVASCANDGKIAGICGETSLQNEERSWWTMIQVYEYYISHHLSKAFESLFGSVTCLPGCFCMYRIRTPDQGKPLIIADAVIREYEDPLVDTLHKKNLLSLGEDRYLTTLMTKHFPHMSYKFIPDAYAHTAAPETWSVLLSQRRRWINSTIHNLAELMFLHDLCGFCCFSMRFVVFVDLFGTIILPATCTYLVYLIYTVSSGKGPIPIISIAMLAGVYGLQAVIFIVKRQWQHVGWMIIYILAFPIFSFVLPLYSFWKQDDFSWGNTRRVIEEKGAKKIVVDEDDGFNPQDIPLQTWHSYALQHNLPGRRFVEGLDDHKSVYSSAQPASTIFDTPTAGMGMPMGPMGGMGAQVTPRSMYQQRQSSYSQAGFGGGNGSVFGAPPYHMSASNLTGVMTPGANLGTGLGPSRLSSYTALGGGLGNGSSMMLGPMNPSGYSTDNLATTGGTPLLGRPMSSIPQLPSFQTLPSQGPSDTEIRQVVEALLSTADLDQVTQKQLKRSAEIQLGGNLSVDRKVALDKAIDEALLSLTGWPTKR